MKGTLIKRGEGDYKLFVNDTPLGQSKESPYKKLSIKNCQAIENGYDLDELASEFSYNQSNEDSQESFAKFAFTEGFQKAMELMEGKKYSEEDVLRLAIGCWNIASRPEYGATYNINEIVDNFIQSLQHKEWEVEILDELDKDGCLILKRL